MNIAFIPVRGGSKSIPFKNIKKLYGKPLVYWTAKAANDCKHIDKVIISTDSSVIAETANSFGFEKLQVVSRSDKSATDTASTESVMLEYAKEHNFDNIVLIQATSPLLTSKDLDNGFELFNSENTDSVLSAVHQKRFNWEINENQIATPKNYDVYNRPRRQDFDGYYTENGAFYITSKDLLMKSQNRISGNIKISKMSEDTFFEIDEPSDWLIVESIMRKKSSKNANEFPEIKMIITDCDGCLTDGGMYYSENGDELKKFNTRDGAGAGLLKQEGYLLGIITGENVELNSRRAKKMNFDFVHGGISDKLSVLEKVSKKYNIPLKNIAYIGDDLIDIQCIRECGFGVCPADAVDEVRQCSDYICKAKGGEGVFREVADLILKNAK